jgi:NAD(P)-dependent dehydrogenase (short-subunit alcohol dehydrogenase family)
MRSVRVLITGASRGIGLEFARQYAAAGEEVIATCRIPSAASELAEIATACQAVEVRQLDVTDPVSIDRLAAGLGSCPGLDVLINNAGDFGESSGELADVRQPDWTQMFQVNTIGPLLVTRALLPHLLRSAKPVVVGLSSVKASIGRNHMGRSYQYRATKAGLNAVLRSLAVDFADSSLCVVALSPGWVYRNRDPAAGLSDDERLHRARKFMNEYGGRGARVTLSQSVSSMIGVIARLTPGDTGSFFDHDGDVLPW